MLADTGAPAVLALALTRRWAQMEAPQQSLHPPLAVMLADARAPAVLLEWRGNAIVYRAEGANCII